MRYLFILVFILVSIAYAQPIIIQNVYSDEASDGCIVFDQNQQHIIAYFEMNEFFIGDLYDDWIHNMCANYGYLSFVIPEPIDGYHLNSAYLSYRIVEMFGDNIPHNYPQFDLTSGVVEPPLLIEHIDFGSTITWQDINPVILDEPAVMMDSLTTGWQIFPLTSYVQSDIDSGRNFTQYRMRLLHDSDWDSMDDCIMIGYDSPGYRPYLSLEFVPDSTAALDDVTTSPVIRLSNSPNPFFINTDISYELSRNEKIEISIYNMKGQRIKTVIDGEFDKGKHNVVWDGKDNKGISVSSGVYFYKLKTPNKSIIKKCLLLK